MATVGTAIKSLIITSAVKVTALSTFNMPAPVAWFTLSLSLRMPEAVLLRGQILHPTRGSKKADHQWEDIARG